jgi:hypothetical protein
LDVSETDEQYISRVREECFKAILMASVTDGKLRLKEKQIFHGVISAIAMIHASQDATPSIEKTALMSDTIARQFREQVAELKAAKGKISTVTTRRKH